MSIRFLHTADWQIGKPYGPIESTDNQASARQARINSIQKIGSLASEHDASFVVVAGDLFDSITPDRQTVHRTCSAIGEMGVPVYVIPGNHDHAGPGSVWHQPYFREALEEYARNLKVLLTNEPLLLEGAVILPCPLLRKQESIDTTAGLRTMDFSTFGDKVRIVLAHGSVQSFGSSEEADIDGSQGAVNQIDLGQLPSDEIDFIALGDWHGVKEVSDRAWYSGTHETDRFPKGEGYVSGHVLLVEASRSGRPKVTTHKTTELNWHSHDTELGGMESLDLLEEDVRQFRCGRVGMDLLKLDLRGFLGIEQMQRLHRIIETWNADFLHVDVSNGVVVAPTEEEVMDLRNRAEDPIISKVAGRLMDLARENGPEAEIAKEALRELHAVLHPR